MLDDNYASMNSEVVAGNYVMVAVTDSGHGIPADILDNVFEPFFTTKDVDKGSGLGLSMVYGFVKQSSGHIKIYSEEGHGTTVRIYLPQVAGARRARRGGEPLKHRRRPRDHPGGRGRQSGADVRGWPDSKPGLRHAGGESTRRKPWHVIDGPQQIDLLFTDMIMPGSMNGRQLADAALLRRAALKILFTSGYSNDAIIHHGHLDAGVLLLAKPYRKSDLARMIRAALAA